MKNLLSLLLISLLVLEVTKIGEATPEECNICVFFCEKQFPHSNCPEACGDYCGKGADKGAQGGTGAQIGKATTEECKICVGACKKQFPQSNCPEACGDYCGKGTGSKGKGAQGGNGAQTGKATTEECKVCVGFCEIQFPQSNCPEACGDYCEKGTGSKGKGAQGGTGEKIGEATTEECKICVGACKKQFPQSNCPEACSDYCEKGSSSNGKGAYSATKAQHSGPKV
ncbi:hypothetical protein ACFE04_017756 [Oxalis oulophora]